jgi:hypothetical protein
VAQDRLLSWNLPGGTKENQEKHLTTCSASRSRVQPGTSRIQLKGITTSAKL